jgi:integrase
MCTKKATPAESGAILFGAVSLAPILERVMKQRFRLVQLGNRGGAFYCKDILTGSRTSLKTKDRADAERLILHRNEALRHPLLNRKIGMAYLAGTDSAITKRSWQDVMDDIIKDKQGPTLRRWRIAIRDKAFVLIRHRVVIETLAEELLLVLRTGKVSTNVYLRRLQNHCLGMGWLPLPILPRKLFPRIVHREKRAITWDEHCQIINRERNAERRDFYDLCWHLGGSQSDIASLKAEDFDGTTRSFCYARKKTANMGGTKLGAQAWEIIGRRPRPGPLFPYLIQVREADRATEFKQRCDGLGIKGVTLHSYRYAWAERSANAGYPERYAQRALGQNSKIVHRAYARKAQGQLPSLEDYENVFNSGHHVVLKSETEAPASLPARN